MKGFKSLVFFIHDLNFSFQLLITIAFNQVVKLHSLKVQGPDDGKLIK